MKILHVTSDWKWTGPSEPMLHAVTGLRALGWPVDVAWAAAPPGSGLGIEERARVRGLEPVHRFTARQGWLPLRDRGEVQRLRATLRRGAYDLVHAHHTRDHILAWLAARPLGIPLVASWHHGDPIPARPWQRWLYGPRGCAGLTVLTESVAESARAFGGRPERVAVIPGAVDAERFAPRPASEALRAELGLAPDQRVVGVVARLQQHRRFDLLLEGFARARREAPGLRLLVVGRGTRAREVLEEPVARLGLEAAVVRAGYRSDDYQDVLSLADALVFLVPGSDGSCRAVLEAMALEIPTIASRRGALPDTVADGVTGRLIDEDPQQLADALVDLWRNPTAWAARGKAARRRVLERHSVAALGGRLRAFYEELAVSANWSSASSR